MGSYQPSVFIYGIRLDEPVTTVTDLLLSAICFYAFFRLTGIGEKRRLHLYLKYYFLSMGIAAVLGGVMGHGFLYLYSFAWKLPGWLISMFSIALIERASIELARKLIPQRLGRALEWLNILELLTFMTLVFFTMNFIFVQIYTTYGLLIVVVTLNIFIYTHTRDPGSMLIIIAVAITAIGALVFMYEWSIHKWFIYQDLSHVILAISALFFYKASRVIILNTQHSPE